MSHTFFLQFFFCLLLKLVVVCSAVVLLYRRIVVHSLISARVSVVCGVFDGGVFGKGGEREWGMGSIEYCVCGLSVDKSRCFRPCVTFYQHYAVPPPPALVRGVLGRGERGEV